VASDEANLDVTDSCDYSTIDRIKGFQRRTVIMPRPDGRADPGGRTFDGPATVAAGKPCVPKPLPAAPDDNEKYTDNPNEVTPKRTTPSAGDAVTPPHQAWPELTEKTRPYADRSIHARNRRMGGHGETRVRRQSRV